MNVTSYKELSFIVKLILKFSHGQATVELGFNINSSVLKTKIITPEAVFIKIMIKDHLIANNLKLHAPEITIPLIKAFRSARPADMYGPSRSENKTKGIKKQH